MRFVKLVKDLWLEGWKSLDWIKKWLVFLEYIGGNLKIKVNICDFIVLKWLWMMKSWNGCEEWHMVDYKCWFGWWSLRMTCGNGSLMLDNCILWLFWMFKAWFVNILGWILECVGWYVIIEMCTWSLSEDFGLLILYNWCVDEINMCCEEFELKNLMNVGAGWKMKTETLAWILLMIFVFLLLEWIIYDIRMII